MKRDISKNMGIVQALPPLVMAADNTPAAIDISNFAAAVLILHIGVGGITFDGSNKIEFKLTHSNDNSTYTAVTDDDVKSAAAVGAGGIIESLIAAHAAATVTKIGYHGGQKFLKLLADFSGTHGTGTPISAIVIGGEPLIAPV